MNKKTLIPVIGLGICASAHSALLINFQRTSQANNEDGYQNYVADHEVANTFNTQTFATSFAVTGAANVTITPSFPSTTDARVQQMIARSATQQASWEGDKTNLLAQWIGTDARTANGGLGTGAPTYMDLSIGGLPAASYSMVSYHHDVENMNSNFSMELSTDGGLTFSSLGNGRITNSLAGGQPAENEVLPGSGVNIAGGNPADLSSTQNVSFNATGDDVVFRYAAIPGELVHTNFFVLNGLELNQQSVIPEPSTGLLGLIGVGFLLRRRR